MPFLRKFSWESDFHHLEHEEARPPMTNILMRNAFLVLRLVFLGLLCNFAILSFIFAILNVNATVMLGISASGSSVFIIFQSSLVLCGVTVALADFIRPKARLSRTLIECSWVGVLSMFQIGAAIGAVIGVPQSVCQFDDYHNICVSSSLLVPISWLSACIFLTYFLTLFIAVMVHKSTYPDIWRRTIYSIPWFEQAAENSPLKEKSGRDSWNESAADDKDIYAAFYHDLESTTTRKLKYNLREPTEPSNHIRRGIDPPFARAPGQAWTRSSPTATDATLAMPSFPHRSADPFALTPGGGPRSVEKFKESSMLARTETPEQFTKHYHAHTNSFPLSVLDLDQPIPLTRLSEWVKAEDMKDDRHRSQSALFGV